ncbi:angiopoietin-related protein 2-like [Drosophila willistoni]|uniref:angiopoietin-related protein 2-like n=1 Tax=Drosophila willistoni TaxID=7260 RepID=UPI000C26CAB3|nr:angiopoietin-related protein 2-like [Drosophila willistoni]
MINHFTIVKEQIDAHDEMKGKINDLEKQVENFKTKLNEREIQVKDKDDVIKARDEQIKNLIVQINKHSMAIKEEIQQLKQYKEQQENRTVSGLYYDGIHQKKIQNLPPFEVSFVSPSSDWIVIQRRIDGNVSFDRDWDDYKNGFGDVRGNFFIGLDKLHLLTQSRPHELYIQLQDVNGINKYARYDNFNVASDKENYKLISIGKYTGNAGDSLDKHVGYMFSTRDRDHKVHTRNCADGGRGGWWFLDGCGFSHLNGIYHEDGIASDHCGISWGSFAKWNYEISLTVSQMMIRPTLQLK